MAENGPGAGALGRQLCACGAGAEGAGAAEGGARAAGGARRFVEEPDAFVWAAGAGTVVSRSGADDPDGEEEVWEYRAWRAGGSAAPYLAREYRSDWKAWGIRPSLLRAVGLWRHWPGAARVSRVVLSSTHPRLLWCQAGAGTVAGESARGCASDDSAAPTAAGPPPDRGAPHPSWTKVWAAQAAALVAWFAERGAPYSSLVLPPLFARGAYLPALSALVARLPPPPPSLPAEVVHRFRQVSRADEARAAVCAAYGAPETILGASAGPASDMWAVGCVLLHLLAGAPPPFEAVPSAVDAHFAQLMMVFHRLGTPDEESWPGVTRLPHYCRDWPRWRSRPAQHMLPSGVDPVAADLVGRLLVLDPARRLTPAQCLEHAFFDELRAEAGGGALRIDARQCLREVERLEAVPAPFPLHQRNISPSMRSVLVDWLVEVADEFSLNAETLFATVSLVDRFIVRQTVRRTEFQLLGEACLAIACKAHDPQCISLSELNFMSADTYTAEQIRRMEVGVLRTLDANVGCVTPLHYLRAYAALARAPPDAHRLAQCFCEMFLLCGLYNQFTPSCVAFSALVAAVHCEAVLRHVQWMPRPAADAADATGHERRAPTPPDGGGGGGGGGGGMRSPAMMVAHSARSPPPPPADMPLTLRGDPSWSRVCPRALLGVLEAAYQRVGGALAAALGDAAATRRTEGARACLPHMLMIFAPVVKNRNLTAVLVRHGAALRRVAVAAEVASHRHLMQQFFEREERPWEAPADAGAGAGAANADLYEAVVPAAVAEAARAACRRGVSLVSSLPVDMLLNVLEFLPPLQWCRVAGTCRALCHVCSSSALWASRFACGPPAGLGSAFAAFSDRDNRWPATAQAAGRRSVLEWSGRGGGADGGGGGLVEFGEAAASAAPPLLTPRANAPPWLRSPSRPGGRVLRTLDLSPYRERLDDAVVSRLAPRLARVESLNLSRARLCVATVNRVFEACGALQVVDLSHATEPAPEELAAEAWRAAARARRARTSRSRGRSRSRSSSVDSTTAAAEDLPAGAAGAAAAPVAAAAAEAADGSDNHLQPPPKRHRAVPEEGGGDGSSCSGDGASRSRSTSPALSSVSSSTSSRASKRELAASEDDEAPRSSKKVRLDVPPSCGGAAAGLFRPLTGGGGGDDGSSPPASRSAASPSLSSFASGSTTGASSPDDDLSAPSSPPGPQSHLPQLPAHQQHQQRLRAAPPLPVLSLEAPVPPALSPPPGLRALDARGCALMTAAGLAGVVSGCPRLAALNLGGLDAGVVGPQALAALAASACAPLLEELHLASCPGVTDAALVTLAARCTSLRELLLDMCERLTDAGVAPLVRANPGLVRLGLAAVPVGDETLFAVSERCPHLDTVDLSFCYRVTAHGVARLASRCGRLARLGLCLVSVSDECVAELASGCALIEELNLRGCEVSDRALAHVSALAWPRLRLLYLLDCPLLTERAVDEARARCPPSATLLFSDPAAAAAAAAAAR